MSLPKEILKEKFRRLVKEDVGYGDITTFCTIAPGTLVEAEISAKEKGIIAGLEEALVFLEAFGMQARPLTRDGARASPRSRLLHIQGDAVTLLAVERMLLNMLSRMSGIATYTDRLVGRIRKVGLKTVVAATRKTALGMAYFDKKAVIIGGGDPHRWNLDDMILIKDNHIAVVGSVSEAVKRVRKKASFSKKIEVEVHRVSEVLEAAKAGVDIVMLDNFTPRQAQEAIDLLKTHKLRNKVLVEASGGITERSLLKYAKTGVDIVSLGEITQDVKALDLSLEITKVKSASRAEKEK